MIVSFPFLCRTTRLSSFPDYLMVQLKKFTIGDDWVPKKLGKASVCVLYPYNFPLADLLCNTVTHWVSIMTDVAVDVPDILDLTGIRGKGKQPSEEELPSDKPEETGGRIFLTVAYILVVCRIVLLSPTKFFAKDEMWVCMQR